MNIVYVDLLFSMGAYFEHAFVQVAICALVFAVVAMVSAGLVSFTIKAAKKWRIMDIPNERSSHTVPTPRGGGLAIVLICFVGCCFYAVFSLQGPKVFLWTYILAAALMTVVSGLDDLFSLHTFTRLIAHFLAALVIVKFCGFWSSLILPFDIEIFLGMGGAVLSMMWIVGLANAYNFMDGIDGIAGGQAVVAGIGWVILGEITGFQDGAWLGFLIAASASGFLIYNRPPAQIFMGDVGSAFLGLTFAVLPVVAVQVNPRLAVAGVLLVWPFIFDSVFTFLRRLFNCENIFQAHRSHLYQRLVRTEGWTHGKVSLLYMLLATVGIVQAVSFVQWPIMGSWLIAILTPVLAGGLWISVVCNEKQLNVEIAQD
jgi:Fuc2NAc and GlcNAc transferase